MNILRLIAITAVATVVVACGGGSDNGQPGNGPQPPAVPGPVVTAAGGTVETVDRTVKLVIPAGALDAPSAISITRLDPSTPPGGLPTTATKPGGLIVLDSYQFGPDGLDFAQPARLTITYNPASLPAGVTPDRLAIAKLRDDGLVRLARNLVVDGVHHTLSADIDGFSTNSAVVLPRPPVACGYADETLNEDLQVDSITTSLAVLSFTTTVPDPGCTGDPILRFVIERAPASVSIQGAAIREPLDREYSAWDWFLVGDVTHRTANGRFVTSAGPVTAGQSYRFRVKGYSLRGHEWMPAASIRVDAPAGSASITPPPPEHFAAAWDDPYALEYFSSGAAYASTLRVRLNWSPVPQADHVKILRRRANELLYSTLIAAQPGVTAYDSDVTADGHYFYRVVAVSGANESSFVEQEVLPLGTSTVSDPAFHLCFASNNLIYPVECGRPHRFTAAPGSRTTLRFKVLMVPLTTGVPSPPNVPDCEIRFALFNATNGIRPPASGAFAPDPLQHRQQTGLQSYDVELALDVAPTATFGVHGVTLYATGCAGTVAKQPLLIDVRPAGTQLVATAMVGRGDIRGTPLGLGVPGDVDCPTTGCLAYFPFGTQLDLSASTTVANLRFDHWLGDCANQPNPCRLTVDADKVCSAVFATSAATASAGLINATHYDSYARGGNSQVYAWGLDGSEELGNGAGDSPSRIPLPVLGVADASAIARSYGGSAHQLAIRASGEVWGWGFNNTGQLGDGTTATQPLPVPMKDAAGATVRDAMMVVGGGNHSLVLTTAGAVWASGGNPGDGSLVFRTHAAPVPGLSGIVSIAAGVMNSYAVKVDGTVWAWGDNAFGGLGDGTTAFRSTPVQVVGLANIVDVVAGYQFALALDRNGDVWSWGLNTYGQLGDGTTANRLLPAKVASLGSVKAIAAGIEHSFAIMADQSLRAWGRNANGRLGLGDQTTRLIPTAVGGLGPVRAVVGGETHSLALLTDGTLWAWGSNGGGQLGLGTTVGQFLTPQQIPGLTLN